jgi:WD40 repeat protein
VAAARADLGLDRAAAPAPAAEQMAQARLLYRDGVDLRLGGKFDDAIRQFRRAYALAPHPLTAVQIALAHRAAGREVEARKASARALALAEHTRGGVVQPRLRGGHSGEVTSLAFDRQGHLLASASADGTARLWELSTGREHQVLAHADGVTHVGFAGDQVVTHGGSGRVRVWDPDSGALVGELASRKAGAPAPYAVAIGGVGIAIGHARSVELWDVTARRVTLTLPTKAAVQALALSADGAWIAVNQVFTEVVEVFDAKTGERVVELPAQSEAMRPIMLAFSPDRSVLAINYSDEAYLHRTSDWRAYRRHLHPRPARTMAVDDHAVHLAVGGVGLSEVNTDGGVAPFEGILAMTAVALTTDGATIAGAGSWAGRPVLMLWSADGGQPTRVLGGGGVAARALAFGAEGELHAAGPASEGSSALLWRSGRPLQHLRSPTDPTWAPVAFDPAAARAAVGGASHAIGIWDAATGSLVRSVPLESPATTLAVSADGSRTAVQNRQGISVRGATGDPVLLSKRVLPTDLTFSRDGGRLITTAREVRSGHDAATGDLLWGHLRRDAVRIAVTGDLVIVTNRNDGELIDARSGHLLRTLPAGPAAATVDGALVAHADGNAAIIEDRAGRRVARLAIGGRVGGLALTGDRAAILDTDAATMQIWDWRKGVRLHTWPAPVKADDRLTLSADGSRLLIAGAAVTLVRTRDGQPVLALAPSWRATAALAPDGARLAVAAGRTIDIIDAERGTRLHTLDGGGPLAWSGDGRFLVSSREQGAIRIVDLARERPSPAFDLGPAAASRVAFADQGRALAVAADRTLQRRAPDGGALRWTAALDRPIDVLVAPRRGPRWFAAAGGRLTAFDAATGAVAGPAALADIADVAASDDGTVIAVATGNAIHVLDAELAGRRVVEPTAERVAVSADGAHLAAGGPGLRLWATAGSGAPVVLDRDLAVTALAFSAGGDRIAAASPDGAIRIWAVTGGPPLLTLMGALDAPLAVIAADGRVDGAPGDAGGAARLLWQVGDVTLPGFVGWQRQQSSDLLAELLAPPRR